MNPLHVTRDNIWTYPQNRPSQIIADFERLFGVPRESTALILMARGVCKWLAARRDVIRLKDVWKSRVTAIIDDIHTAKRLRDREQLLYLRGYLKAHEECRAELLDICHSERWRLPDHDEKVWDDLQEEIGDYNADQR